MVIEPQVVNELEYNVMRDEVTTLHHTASINYGETKKKGVVFTTYTDDYTLMGDLIEAVLALAVDIVQYGIEGTAYGVNNQPRLDLQPCLDNSKVFIMSNRLIAPRVLNNYFNHDEIIYPDKLSNTLKSIVTTNKQTIKDRAKDSELY